MEVKPDPEDLTDGQMSSTQVVSPNSQPRDRCTGDCDDSWDGWGVIKRTGLKLTF